MSKSVYIDRYAWKERLFPSYTPSSDLGLIIVIPVYKEKFLLEALESLDNCNKPSSGVLIIIVINESIDEPQVSREVNQACEAELESYRSNFPVLYSYQQLPPKKAGVGLARKIGMDEAVRIFEEISEDGIIICFDADCTCEKNYLIEIEKHFADKEIRAGIVFYEHALQGINHSAIVNYELYLRYYIDAIRHTKFPFSHQTLGSCIAIRSSTYQSEGGMNTRKAGEDFYFLNKIIPLGRFKEINKTTIYPSDRVSDRVPFGTGKAVGQLLHSIESYKVYNPRAFEDLKSLFSQVTLIWKDAEFTIPESIDSFFAGNFQKEVAKIKKQTTSIETFTQRFFLWFDAFKILKFVHFVRDHLYPNIPLEEALQWLNSVHSIDLNGSKEEQLKLLRSFDRGWLHQIE